MVLATKRASVMNLQVTFAKNALHLEIVHKGASLKQGHGLVYSHFAKSKIGMLVGHLHVGVLAKSHPTKPIQLTR